MKAFIKKHEYNYIKKCLRDLNSAFVGCIDAKVVEVTKFHINNKILNLFTNLSEEEKNIVDITKITDSSYIDNYLYNLNNYVYGIPSITKEQISKLFKKEKKLKLPNLDEYDSKNVYLGWIDESLRKLFLVYNMNGKLVGMVCRIANYRSNNTHMCALCNHIGGEDEVAFVSSICKTSNAREGNYRSIGFNICLDSDKCNDRIVAIEKLEKILKNVNNIK
ncbi:FusB/FusC family EF-G-binding protein [Clostridium tetani]|uniref:Elongation factor G-binding protein n=1 Tax=Clostridium tetani TaxID=1513 RepID=A0ABY0ES18_CLOTA|nr:elongation factor G-binding protein [Clostridium tetani]KHO40392.1 fibronectin-binding protein [Clostridium tetani]RXI40572.1 elongation factor G-binding protein [Clostridium tetani]RXI58268.1 elongation factor G-binding protein [Clostridium tetani]RXI70580.1 elongation factor G-binding protein [Clostridium tetani]